MQRIKARLMLVDLAGSERASLAAANSASQKQAGGWGLRRDVALGLRTRLNPWLYRRSATCRTFGP